MALSEVETELMNRAEELVRDGHGIPEVACALIAVGVGLAEAAGGRDEAVQLLHEMLGTIAPAN